jgi:starvation-inducible DNA-binding protein
VHLELDEIVDTARLSADRVAERVATLGAVPDGRSAAVAKDSGLKAFPLGQVKTTEVVERVTTMIDTIAGRVRERIARSADPDPVTQDILIEAGDQLEKHAWMLRAQQA